ncbi:cytochrome P450 [Schizophyllum commune H4-8]|uniref:cytochrome P450 n=1 Tax=Schizophyllum commune (strain H4-8 / FGSC 9210) TaxID=578458 RepID=UPI00215E0998|nr:cytochrome P450 [Schizophyllum commune H4-8]KAI5891509.1 cytochrome P450 [Schizophyllum commune H4-8]
MTSTIPQPAGWPFIGNIFEIDTSFSCQTFHRLMQQFGEIYQLNLMGRRLIVVSSHALLNELSDDRRFKKAVGGALMEARNLLHDGLFTAFNHEANWAVAHRLLSPSFRPSAVRQTFDGMREICADLVGKWVRNDDQAPIDLTADFTRLALDTIAYCTMSYRMNSFATDDPPRFNEAMSAFLLECNGRANRPYLINFFMRGRNAAYTSNIEYMRGVAENIIAERRISGREKHDLLHALLHGRDPRTKEGLSDREVADNVLTFLLAGHETTSATMSFAIYYILKNPDVLRKLQTEIYTVVGDQPIQCEDLDHLHYLTAILRETLRLQPPAFIRVVYSVEDTTIGGGRYAIPAGSGIALLIREAHRDPAVWGADAHEFRPERMADGRFEDLPPNAWQPFGYGARGCIGKNFSWQEMRLVLCTLVQQFDLALADPAYELELSQAMTIKPKNLAIRATPKLLKACC